MKESPDARRLRRPDRARPALRGISQSVASCVAPLRALGVDVSVGSDPHLPEATYVAPATMVVCVSEHPRRDAIRWLGPPHVKIVVVHHAIDLERAAPEVAPMTKAPKRYILFVGKRHGSTTFGAAFEAFARVAADHRDRSVVCSGGGPLTEEESERVAQVELAARVLRICAPDRQLRWLERHATAFDVPPRYEGFGIPILEAFAQACPAISTRASCFLKIAARGLENSFASCLAA